MRTHAHLNTIYQTKTSNTHQHIVTVYTEANTLDRTSVPLNGYDQTHRIMTYNNRTQDTYSYVIVCTKCMVCTLQLYIFLNNIFTYNILWIHYMFTYPQTNEMQEVDGAWYFYLRMQTLALCQILVDHWHFMIVIAYMKLKAFPLFLAYSTSKYKELFVQNVQTQSTATHIQQVTNFHQFGQNISSKLAKKILILKRISGEDKAYRLVLMHL